jgi:hypothetical protein
MSQTTQIEISRVRTLSAFVSKLLELTRGLRFHDPNQLHLDRAVQCCLDL